MTTLSATEACGQIAELLERAAAGEEIGIDVNGRLLRLHPADDTSWAEQEYGMTREELQRATKNLSAEVGRQRAAGEFKEWLPGEDFDAFLEKD